MYGGFINIQSVKYAANNPKEKKQLSLTDLNIMLDNEVSNTKIKWSKLLMIEKIKKLNTYITSLTQYNDAQKKLLKQYIRLCINRKKLLKDKDVKYNPETGLVENIHGLNYNETSKKFTISNKVSKPKVKATKTTIKNKHRELTTNSINGIK
jgi:hypothetical protein